MSPRRRPPATLDRVSSYRILDARGVRILDTTFGQPEKGFDACCHAAHVLAITPGAVRVVLRSSRGRDRSFTLQTLAQFIEQDQVRGKDATNWLRELGLLVGWGDMPKRLAKVKP